MHENNYGAYNNTIDLFAFIRYVLRRSYFIIFGLAIGIIVSIPINKTIVKPTYSCEAKYYLTVSEDIVSYGALQATTTIMQDYLAMIKSRAVVKRAIDRDGLSIDVNTALGMITVSNPNETHLLVVNIKSQDRQQTEDLMRAISNQILSYLPGIMEGSSLLLFEEPDLTMDEGTGKKILNMATLSILFVAIVVVILLILFMVKPVVEDPEDITRVTGGIKTYLLPNRKKRFLLRNKQNREALEKSQDSAMEEIAYDLTLGTNRSDVVLVTSVDEGESGAFVARKLYEALCKEGGNIFIIDRDLSQLQEISSGQKTTTEKNSLLILEQRGILAEALGILKDSYDFIIIDSMPVLQNMDSLILARHCDKVVLAAEYGHTSVYDLEKGIRRFSDNKRTVDSIVLNMRK